MPDPPITPPVTPPAPTPAAPPPVAAPATPVPAKPAEPKLAPAQSPAAGVPDLDPQTQMEIPKKDGTGYEVGTLQDMADALLEKRAGAIVGDDAKKIEALNKAVTGGDASAAHELLDLYIPKAAAADKPVADAERISVLESQLTEVKQLLGNQSPIVQQIEDARIHNGVKGLIGQHAANLPYLAKESDDGARRVTAKISVYREAAKASMGLTDEQFNNHPRRQQILARAMLDCEQELKTLAVRFTGFDPGATAAATANGKPAGGTVAVDDQAAGAAATPGRIPARFQVDGGRLVDTAGQGVVQARHGVMETVPAAPLAGEPSGTAVGATPVQQLQGSFSMDQMKANMRKRQQEISTE